MKKRATIPIDNMSINLVIHFFCWIIIFITPMFFLERGEDNSILWHKYVMHLSVPISFFITFYINYLILIPNFLLTSDFSKSKDIIYFIGFNIYIIAMVSIFIYYWESVFGYVGDPYIDDIYQRPDKHIIAHPIAFVLRNSLLCLVCIIISIFLRMSSNIKIMKEKIKEAEKAKTEAELQNIRNQLNPHFLLNTLNNIYALIQFDSDKAQSAIVDLGKMLRYNLYESKNTLISLQKEINFIKNYVDLMKIRLNENTTITEDFHIETDNAKIAPQILISLVENAFKHGILADNKSFINVKIHESAETETITCTIENSNYPKGRNDVSGSGIGLELVSKRLDLIYKDKYEWTYGVTEDKKRYISKLVIKLNTTNE